MVKVHVSCGLEIDVESIDIHKTQQLSEIKRVRDLRGLYSEVRVEDIQIRIMQSAPIGHGQLTSGGLIYVGIVPSGWSDREIKEKRLESNDIIMMTMGYENVLREVFHVNLSNYECDLAQTARRGALPVFSFYASGVKANQKVPKALGIQLKLTLECAGEGCGV